MKKQDLRQASHQQQHSPKQNSLTPQKRDPSQLQACHRIDRPFRAAKKTVFAGRSDIQTTP